MTQPRSARTPPRILLAGWLIVRNIFSWLSHVVMPTEQDFREADVYLGEHHE
jgi:hypothetical protein